ncbi:MULTISPECIES: CgeB family protein [Campylobacter]|uniref:lipopolysaccharide biosynthesis protein n=1 Tax=Campylobacter TaxID=194 RepID=UPI0014728C7E|nr:MULTISPECIES: lipopolysaccharide biosynthesis protein [unclassified Campylobacter]MBE3022556.1 lipopolysaccharide biosynthesis protein [Campylobacter sp. 7477a]MBE3609034.1 lipopolysaccharide biosynthesis protein [Campylobacter sp. RM12916]
MNLDGKTILLLAPKFFGYENKIKKELENFGASVIYFDERPKNDFLTKVFIRLNFKFFIKKSIYKYYGDITLKTKKLKIDYLFLVSPETINSELVNNIKSLHPDIKTYVYMWDSIKNKKNGFELLGVADKFFTFDPDDINVDKKIQFLPLFYVDDYKNLKHATKSPQYDISFVGTIHSDRYPIVKKLEKDFKVFHYFYSPNRLLFGLQRLFKGSFKSIDQNDIHFNSLSKDELLSIIGDSKAVIDIEHPSQKGLTMRTIEMLGAGKKFITTNSSIKKYDFYNELNILVIDRKKPIINDCFLNMPYVNIRQDIYDKYSLNNWIKCIFS